MGDPIPIERAWMIFDSWKAQARDIGVIFYGQSGTVYTMARVNSARNGSLRFSGEFGSASFNLRDARFLYGPVQIFPRWPMPPAVDVVAVQACTPHGDWLVLAEGLKPEWLGPLALSHAAN